MTANSFIEKHGLWTDDQKRRAAELKLFLEKDRLQFVRVAWADPHGASRAKAVTVPAFLAALEAGYNINVATTTLDSANARTFSSFTRGGGMGLPEMTGSPNLTIVPDPTTFRVLPWTQGTAPGVGWVLCDEYFNTGMPFHFSPRHLLRGQLRRLSERGLGMVVGLEVEWYLLRVVQEQLNDDNIGAPGARGWPVKTAPIEPGYSYHSETNMDLMQPVLAELAAAFEKIHLPLRSVENEWGPGQVECTFAARGALEAADNLVLFRTATRQIVRRLGCFATFMCRPGLKGCYSSGWHLHQSLIDAKSKRNLFAPAREGEFLSPLGLHFLGGILRHAVAATPFTTPTVNGYRRFRPNSLAPDRAGWGYDHRGAMLRVLGAPGDAASRIENRAGEPAANPYLFIASQIVAGLDGVDSKADPGPRDEEPYAADRPLLPKSLPASLDALEKEPVFRKELGDVFIDYFLKLKRNEAGRFQKWIEEGGVQPPDDGTTEWEQREYFDFF
ncbi:MAG: glutamine synthetase family protein [Xanthobacteraceae bacterium]